MEWTKNQYNKQYDSWVPWLEDLYLHYFTKDNKASYSTKQNLDKTKVTGIDQVDTLQDGVHGVLAGQVGKGGLAQPVGDAFSKEGINRVERKGRDDKGAYVSDPTGLSQGAQAVAGKTSEGVSAVGNTVGNTVGGLFGGGKKAEAK